MQQSHHRWHAIDHCRIHHLPEARLRALEQGCEDAKHQEHRTTAEIRHQVQGRHRRFVGPADGVQGPRESQVVDIVAGGVCEGTCLSPAGDPAVYQAGIRAQADVRAETQPLHDARAESFDQHIRAVQQLVRRREAFDLAQVQRHRALVASVHVGGLGLRRTTIHGHDVSAEVGQQLADQGPGADAAEFDDAQRCQRAVHLSPFRVRRVRGRGQ